MPQLDADRREVEQRHEISVVEAIVGLDRVPEGEAVVFAVNHPNGLVDPLFLLCFAPRPVSFLGKAPLFGYPIIGWFV